jgi:hypothetical protein
MSDASEQIERVLRSFDFEAVHSYMAGRTTPKGRPKPWTWGGANVAPSINELLSVAREILWYAINSVASHRDGSCATGGFRAQCARIGGALTLEFDGQSWPKGGGPA